MRGPAPRQPPRPPHDPRAPPAAGPCEPLLPHVPSASCPGRPCHPPASFTATPRVTASAPMMVWVGGQGLPAHCPVLSWPPCPVFQTQQPPRAGVGQDMVPQPQPPPSTPSSSSGMLWGVIVPPLPAYSAVATGLNWEGSPSALQIVPQCPCSASPATAAGTLPKRCGEVPAWAQARLAEGGPADSWRNCCGHGSKAAMSHVPQALPSPKCLGCSQRRHS